MAEDIVELGIPFLLASIGLVSEPRNRMSGVRSVPMSGFGYERNF